MILQNWGKNNKINISYIKLSIKAKVKLYITSWWQVCMQITSQTVHAQENYELCWLHLIFQAVILYRCCLFLAFIRSSEDIERAGVSVTLVDIDHPQVNIKAAGAPAIMLSLENIFTLFVFLYWALWGPLNCKRYQLKLQLWQERVGVKGSNVVVGIWWWMAYLK